MVHTAKHLVFGLLFTTLFSCTKDTLDSESTVREGIPIQLSIAISDPNMVTRYTGLTPSQEAKIDNISVLIFNSSGNRVSFKYFDSNITSNLHKIKGVSGNNMSIYLVANISTTISNGTLPGDFLKNITTVSQLNDVLLYNQREDVIDNLHLVMTGAQTSLTIPDTGTTSVTIQLNYVAAKIRVCAVSDLTNTSDFAGFSSWTVKSYANISRLLPQSTDAATPGTAGHFLNSGNYYTWNDSTFTVSGKQLDGLYTVFYVFENRRGANGNTIQTQKAGNAPTNATSVVLQGYYNTNATGVTTTTTMTIPLGANNTNDYNITRGGEYEYFVTVKGIGQVNIDTRYKGTTGGTQPTILNPGLDCHYDWRPLQIKSYAGAATVAIFSDAACTIPSTWMKVSTKNITKFTSTNTRPTYNPATDLVTSLNMTFTGAGQTTQTIYLYVDENITGASRRAYVQIIGNDATGVSSPVVLPFTQASYQSLGSTAGLRTLSTTGVANADDYILAIENFEESQLHLTPGATAGTEATNSMAWGHDGIIMFPTASGTRTYYCRNGFTNNLRLLFGNTTGALSSTLTSSHNRTGTVTAQSAIDVIFNTNASRYCFEKNRDLDGDGKITNPNTAGVNEIKWYLPSQDELLMFYVGQPLITYPLTTNKYYYSSTEFYGSVSTSTALWNQIPSYYGTSSNYAKAQLLYVRCVRQIPNATPTSPYVETNSRIINNTGFAAALQRSAPTSCPTPMHVDNAAPNTTISPRFQVAKVDCLVSGTTGAALMNWASACGYGQGANSSNSVGVPVSQGCNAYSEPGAPVGTWRLPTQRELLLILTTIAEMPNGQDGFVPLATINQSYWSSTTSQSNYAEAFIVSPYNHTSNVGSKLGASISARCIRDL